MFRSRSERRKEREVKSIYYAKKPMGCLALKVGLIPDEAWMRLKSKIWAANPTQCAVAWKCTNIGGASTVSFTIQNVDDLHYRGKIYRQRVFDAR